MSQQLAHIANTQAQQGLALADIRQEQGRQGRRLQELHTKIFGNGAGLLERTARLEGEGPARAARLSAKTAIRVALIGLVPAALAFLAGWVLS